MVFFYSKSDLVFIKNILKKRSPQNIKSEEIVFKSKEDSD